MKKIIVSVLLLGVIAPIAGFAYVSNGLSYPEIGISKEILPSETFSLVKVITPNGGENWKAGETYSIKWTSAKVDVDYPVPMCYSPQDGQESAECPPYRPAQASIYLYNRDQSGNVYNNRKHIATVDLNRGHYEWKIPKNISSGDNYVIRIVASLPTNIAGSETEEARPIIYPNLRTWDESDRPFSIYSNNDDLKQLVAQLEKKVLHLQKELNDSMRLIRLIKNKI